MEIVAKISKGSRMDQVYIPKNRNGFSIGSYVIIKPLETKETSEKPYFYNIKYIESVKIDIINKLMGIIDKIVDAGNIIITGSFLDEGFNFNDLDIVLIAENKPNLEYIKKEIRDKLGIKTHIIIMENKVLMKGLSTDPLYQMMLSRCIAKKRFIYKQKYKVNYKLLDLHLLKSKLLIDNFDHLNGNEKYYLIRNMIAIFLYLKNKKISKEIIDREITKYFNLNIKQIKQNMIEEDIFLKKYKIIYKETFDKIIKGIEYDSKQKEIN
ncbi:MAG: hypothetical protein AABW56_03480 [Nanoarchaeota archaeon]